MTYTAHDDGRAVAAAAHLSAITGPIIPAILLATRRDTSPFVAREAAKAVQFSLAMLLLFAAATAVRIFVPLVGFVGTLAQWVVPVVAVYFCIAGFRLSRRGEPAHYPLQFKVVKTDD